MIWYFILISFLGWLFSCLYHLIVEKKFYNKGFLTLPFCPVYGASAVMCYLVLTPLTDNVLILFIGSTLLLSLFLVLSGNIGKKILGCKPWDFSDMRFHQLNFQHTFKFSFRNKSPSGNKAFFQILSIYEFN